MNEQTGERPVPNPTDIIDEYGLVPPENVHIDEITDYVQERARNIQDSINRSRGAPREDDQISQSNYRSVSHRIESGELEQAIEGLVHSAQQQLERAGRSFANLQMARIDEEMEDDVDKRNRLRTKMRRNAQDTGKTYVGAVGDIRAAMGLAQRLPHDQRVALEHRISELLNAGVVRDLANHPLVLVNTTLLPGMRNPRTYSQLRPGVEVQPRAQQPPVRREATVDSQPEQPPVQVETSPQPEQMTAKRKLIRGTKTFIHSFLPTGKSKVGYGLGIAVGVASSAAYFGGLGVPMRLAIAGGVSGASWMMERGARKRIARARTPEERARIEREFGKANRFIRGFSSGMAVTSVANLLGGPAIEKLGDAEVWKNMGEFVSKYVEKIAAIMPEQLKDLWELSRPVRGVLAQGKDVLHEQAGLVAENAMSHLDATKDIAQTQLDGLANTGVGKEIADVGETLRREAGNVANAYGKDIGIVANENYGLGAAWEGGSNNLPEVGPYVPDALKQAGTEMYASVQDVAEAIQEEVREVFGIDVPDTGEVLADGEQYTELSPEALAMINNVEVVVESGDTVEKLFTKYDIPLESLYNSRDTMMQFVFENEQVLKVGNEQGVKEFSDMVMRGGNVPLKEFQSNFYDAVRNIYPGQEIALPVSPDALSDEAGKMVGAVDARGFVSGIAGFPHVMGLWAASRFLDDDETDRKRKQKQKKS